MLTELVILLPLIALCYYRIIPFYIVISTLVVIYWIPKWIFIHGFLNTFYPEVLTRTEVPNNVIHLTFDDVPYGDFREIVDILNEYDQKATFFMISGYNQDNTDLLHAVKTGHQLANHGNTNSMHALLSEEDLRSEIMTCDARISYIYHLAGRLPPQKLYRPGCGVFTNQMLKVVKDLDHKLTLGSVYPNDPIVPIPFVNLEYLKAHIESRDIVILHDRSWTPELLRQLLPWLEQRGYQSSTLDV